MDSHARWGRLSKRKGVVCFARPAHAREEKADCLILIGSFPFPPKKEKLRGVYLKRGEREGTHAPIRAREGTDASPALATPGIDLPKARLCA
jgi:hypothetical protein